MLILLLKWIFIWFDYFYYTTPLTFLVFSPNQHDVLMKYQNRSVWSWKRLILSFQRKYLFWGPPVVKNLNFTKISVRCVEGWVDRRHTEMSWKSPTDQTNESMFLILSCGRKAPNHQTIIYCSFLELFKNKENENFFKKLNKSRLICSKNPQKNDGGAS